MLMKKCIYYSTKKLIRRLTSYKVCLCLIVNTVWYGCNFCGDLGYLSMKFYEALYTWCWHSTAALKQTAAAIATYINYDTGELH